MIYSRMISVGGYLPENIVTNHDLEKMVDTSDEWITQRTGISQRHICTEEEKSLDLAAQASVLAIQRAQLAPEDIDLIVVATCTSDYALPSMACIRCINACSALIARALNCFSSMHCSIACHSVISRSNAS